MKPRIRVRTGHSYHVYFSVVLGQSNATFIEKAATPLARMQATRLAPWFSWADAVTFTPTNGFDAVHSWNAIPVLTRKPFILTFEDYLPRTPDDRRNLRLEQALTRQILSNRCRRVIALSDYAVRQFHQQHRNHPERDALLAKLERIYPVVAPRRSEPKRKSNGLRLLFVGRDFMRKGGPVLLRSHARLRAAGVPVETTIVSSLDWKATDYIGPPDEAYVRTQQAGLSSDGITHHRSLPVAKVYELMEAADYLVFPTFHDTFGFVSIEALAAGTPVIASNTCVMPEVITDGGNGYLLPFENDATVGKWRWLYRQRDPDYLHAYEQATEVMTAALVERLETVWNDGSTYEALSAGAVRMANERFHPDIARKRLEYLYEGFRPASAADEAIRLT